LNCGNLTIAFVARGAIFEEDRPPEEPMVRVAIRADVHQSDHGDQIVRLHVTISAGGSKYAVIRIPL